MTAPIITIDVEKAAGRHDKRLVVPPGAIVSPDARALAAKLGVSILAEGEMQAAPAAAPAVRPLESAASSASGPEFAPIPVISTPPTFVPPIYAVPLAQPVPVVVARPRSSIPVRNVPIENSRVDPTATARRPALPLGIILGKTVRSADVRAARDAGFSLIRHPQAAYVTRAARHAAEMANLTLFADPDLRIEGRPGGPGTVVNPLESGGAITRSGPGVMPRAGLPIGGDQIEGSLGPR